MSVGNYEDVLKCAVIGKDAVTLGVEYYGLKARQREKVQRVP